MTLKTMLAWSGMLKNASVRWSCSTPLL